MRRLSLQWSEPGGVPASSACLDGHFPGNPIVPGAVILAHLAQGLAARGLAIARVERMKFTRALGPDRAFDVTVEVTGPRADAEFRDSGGSFAAARLTLRDNG